MNNISAFRLTFSSDILEFERYNLVIIPNLTNGITDPQQLPTFIHFN